MADEQEMYLELVPLEEGKRRYVFNLVRGDGELLYHHSTLYFDTFFACELLNGAIFTIVRNGVVFDQAVYCFPSDRMSKGWWFDGFKQVTTNGLTGISEDLPSEQLIEQDVVIVDMIPVLDDELISHLRSEIISAEAFMQVYDEQEANANGWLINPVSVETMSIKKQELRESTPKDAILVYGKRSEHVRILRPGESV